MKQFIDSLARIAHWPLRLALSSVFLYHGFIKFPNLEAIAESMNVPVFAIALLASIEIAGALLVLGGGLGRDWMTRLGGLLIMPVMVGAILMIHLPHGWNSVNMGTGNMGRGMEFQFVLLMLATYFVLKGNHTSNGRSRLSETGEIQQPRSADRHPKRPSDDWRPKRPNRTAKDLESGTLA